jgi:hypothetical protein
LEFVFARLCWHALADLAPHKGSTVTGPRRINWPVIEALGLLYFWAIWLYQVFTGDLLGGNWRVFTTEQARPNYYWAAVGIQAVSYFSLTVIFVWNRILH